MRSDNRARSRRAAREAASNPPPLRHLAHYLSIFLSLSLHLRIASVRSAVVSVLSEKNVVLSITRRRRISLTEDLYK